MNDNERPIVNECLDQAHSMLTACWGEIVRVRDAQDKIVALSMSFKIDTTGQSPVVKSKLGFSRRFRAQREKTVDTEQTELPFLSDLNSQSE
jgi:hypothetical protein